MYAIDAEECRLEYSKNWIKARLYGYLLGKGSHESIEHDIHRAKTFGISKAIFQIIIDSLPFERASERFRDIITILREDFNSRHVNRPVV
jgi:hypothetical protein